MCTYRSPTVCPLSNTRLCVYIAMEDHPILSLMEHGLLVTVISDDPAYFGGYVNSNFRTVTEALAPSREQIIRFTKNNFSASLPDQHSKFSWIDKINAAAWYLVIRRISSVRRDVQIPGSRRLGVSDSMLLCLLLAESTPRARGRQGHARILADAGKLIAEHGRFAPRSSNGSEQCRRRRFTLRERRRLTTSEQSN